MPSDFTGIAAQLSRVASESSCARGCVRGMLRPQRNRSRTNHAAATSKAASESVNLLSYKRAVHYLDSGPRQRPAQGDSTDWPCPSNQALQLLCGRMASTPSKKSRTRRFFIGKDEFLELSDENLKTTRPGEFVDDETIDFWFK